MSETSASRFFNPLEHPVIFTAPRRLTPASAWHQHIPFAMYLVEMLRPQLIVELGTHYGDSYCALCQAVQELDLTTQCYAVDTWEGDPQTGFYGAEVLHDLREHHDPPYGSFSNLLQTTFDEAVEHFADKTIDLLHMDGCHTYEAVKHDFERWLPKVSERGVILFHDTNHRAPTFGVWLLWHELQAQYPSFHLLHGHGLGVLLVGDETPAPVRALAQLSEEDLAQFRQFFAVLGQGLQLQVEAQRLAASEQASQALAASEQVVEALRADLTEKDRLMLQMIRSRSWRWTAPLRWARAKLAGRS